MNAQAPGRGAQLVTAGQRIGIGPQWLARAFSGGFHRILDRLDRGLAAGSLSFALPDGTTRLLGGRAAGFDGHVDLHHWRGLLRLATGGSVGGYQGWEQGEWSSPDPVDLFAVLMANAATLGNTGRAYGPWRWLARRLHRLHRNTREGAQSNIHAHYDLGNDFYAAWLGGSMAYSSAIFEDVCSPSKLRQMFDGLDFAQQAKIDTIVNRAMLSAGDTALEIGCGWGVQAFALAETGANVDAISLSDEQLAFCRESARASNPPIDFRNQDYRDVVGQYDAIISVEMVEAVGQEFWPDFFDCIARNLKPGGRGVIQYITIRDDLFESYAASADFIQTYIFPGGMLVRESAFRSMAAERGLEWHDQASFGLHYAETLRLWRQAFDAAVDEGRLPTGFDQRFVALWRFYLMYCEGGFRGGGIDVCQVSLIKR